MYKPLTVTAIYPFDKNPTREEWEDYDYMMRRAGSSKKCWWMRSWLWKGRCGW